ncbi:MAG: hypothetical protein COT15_01780 [Candidatus Diapherotrites archaeon CG08_land_8_20_14_0_20_34_12]|nr:MAG: hypothetical protein COT15_01780 [Candidatus Diapherotrites archaeon CG08_land_8_20_14_0_20_34_12]
MVLLFFLKEKKKRQNRWERDLNSCIREDTSFQAFFFSFQEKKKSRYYPKRKETKLNKYNLFFLFSLGHLAFFFLKKKKERWVSRLAR